MFYFKRCLKFQSSQIFCINRVYKTQKLMNNPDQNRQPPTSNNRKVIFIICIYLFLIMTSRYSPGDHSVKTGDLQNKFLDKNTIISLVDALNIIDENLIYEGTWKKQSKDLQEQPSMLTQNQGNFKIYIYRETTFNPIYYYRVDFQFLDGDYIDKGSLYLDIFIQSNNYIFERTSQKQGFTSYNTSLQAATAKFRKDKVLFTEQEGDFNITQFKFTYTLTDHGFETKLLIGAPNLDVQLSILRPENKGTQTIIFALIMLLCSYIPFRSILTILKSIYQLQDNTRKYSLITIMFTNMWDTVLCIVCFIFSFKDQQSLMLFIIPAFMLCLLFTNLQPRFLIAIYQNLAGNNFNIRQILCRFNLMHYGSLFLIYPIIILTNFNWLFFIGMSCIIFPQIYTNGTINVRPDLSSVYYSQYLLSRFILIFYLKCFPYNVFGFKPDYALGAVCLFIILVQYGLLYIQKMYGSKKVLPSFMLEPVFDYKLQEQLNIQQGVEDHHECSICLTPLHVEPPQNPDELEYEPNFKLMKTPCGHSYHSRCLMVWMKIKMECPQCRFKLPPYQ